MPYPSQGRWPRTDPRGPNSRPGADTDVPSYRRSAGYAPFFRSDRYFTVGHQWYVIKREGGHLGPYLNRDEAEFALAKHVAVLLDLAGQTGRLLDPEAVGPVTPFERRVCTVLARWRRGPAAAAGRPSGGDVPLAG